MVRGEADAARAAQLEMTEASVGAAEAKHEPENRIVRVSCAAREATAPCASITSLLTRQRSSLELKLQC